MPAVTPSPPEPRFSGVTVPAPPVPDDDGTASAVLVARLDEFAAGRTGGAEVLDALARSRLFVPVVAVLGASETGQDGLRREKQSSMATVLVQSPGGGRALLGFSSISSLTRWQAEARPVPVAAPLAARAAVDESADTLLVDVAGPAPFAVAGQELLLLAAGARHPAGACADPVVVQTLRRLLDPVDAVQGAALQPAVSDAPFDVVLTLSVAGGDDSWLDPLISVLSADPTLARLVPGGMRVRLAPDLPDTPNILQPSG